MHFHEFSIYYNKINWIDSSRQQVKKTFLLAEQKKKQ